MPIFLGSSQSLLELFDDEVNEEDLEEFFDDVLEEEIDEEDHRKEGKCSNNQRKKNQNTLTTASNECLICMEPLNSESFVLSDCKHHFCLDCIKGYIQYKCGDRGNLFHTVSFIRCKSSNRFELKIEKLPGIVCPGSNCKRILIESEVEHLADTKSLERFRLFSEIQKNEVTFLENNKKEVKKLCPRCQSSNITTGRRKRLRCLDCKLPFCSICETHHSSLIDCKSPNFQKVWGFDRKSWDVFNLQKCISCSAIIQKIEGCNLITCRCGQKLCYLCGKNITTECYNHFVDGAFGSKCQGGGRKFPNYIK